MSRNEARQILNTEARAHTAVVYFTKKDGTLRRMVCRYFGTTSTKPHLMTVWDMEKGAARSVNLDTVSRIRVLTGRTGPGAGADRAAIPPRRTFGEVKREIDQLFY